MTDHSKAARELYEYAHAEFPACGIAVVPWDDVPEVIRNAWRRALEQAESDALDKLIRALYAHRATLLDIEDAGEGFTERRNWLSAPSKEAPLADDTVRERALDVVLSLPTRMVTHNEDLTDIIAEALSAEREAALSLALAELRAERERHEMATPGRGVLNDAIARIEKLRGGK